MPKPLIAIDIDDVLCRNAEGFAAYSNSRWQTQMAAHDYDEAWAQVWGVSQEEAERRAVELHGSGVIGTYEHVAAAVPVLVELGARFELVLVTSRRMAVKPETDRWIKRYFNNTFSGVHYLGAWESKLAIGDKLKLTKTEICRRIGANYLIDDQLKHCFSAAQAGVNTLLFGEYKWNSTTDLPVGVTRAKDWQAVRGYFNGQQ